MNGFGEKHPLDAKFNGNFYKLQWTLKCSCLNLMQKMVH